MFSRPRRTALYAATIAVTTLVGLMAEVVPRYEVRPSARPGTKLLDTPTFLIGDCLDHRAAIVSMLEDHDLDLRNNLSDEGLDFSAHVSLGRNGAWYPKHSVLVSLVGLPFYAVAGDNGLLAFNLLQIAALLVVMWTIARRYASDELSLAVVLWFAFGTLLRPAAYNFAPDVLSTLFVTAGFALVLYERPLLAGVLMGLSCGVKWTNAEFFLPVLVFLVARAPRSRLVRFGAGAAIPLSALLSMNFYMFGSPFVTSYDRIIMNQGGRVVFEPSHRTFFSLPFWSTLWSQMTDRRIGLFVSDPAIVFAVPGLVVLARRAPLDALLLGSACVLQVATFAKYDEWTLSSYGHRFLMTVVALSAIPVVALLDRILSARPAAAEGG